MARHRQLADPTDFGNRPGDGPLRIGGQSPSKPLSKADLPSTRSHCSERQMAAVEMVRDLWGGTETVRAKGTTYLPKAPGEDPANYQDRLNRSVFFNAFRRTVEGLVGFMFAKDPKLGEDVPPLIVEHWENIDNAGTHGDVFLRELASDSMAAGHNAIHVEFPATGGKQSSKDEIVTGEIRPYWIPIRKENIISWRTTVENGRTILTQLVLKECHMVPEGEFGEKEQVHYRVLYRDGNVVGFRVLEIRENNVVAEVDSGLYPTQTEIPVAEIVTAGKRSMFESDPPLLDLAYLNVAHYQQWSDYATTLHKIVPFLFTAGVNPPDDSAGSQSVTVGPNAGLSSPDPSASATYVAHSGSGISDQKAALDDLKSDMGTLGLSMLAPQKRTAETAEAKRIDKGTQDSALGVTSRGLQDGVERALQFHANYLRLPDGGSITINRDFDSDAMDPTLMIAYATLAKEIGLPLRIVLERLQKMGRIDQSEDLDELELEMMSAKQAADDMKRMEMEEQERERQESLRMAGKMPPEQMAA